MGGRIGELGVLLRAGAPGSLAGLDDAGLGLVAPVATLLQERPGELQDLWGAGGAVVQAKVDLGLNLRPQRVMHLRQPEEPGGLVAENDHDAVVGQPTSTPPRALDDPGP